MSLILDTDTFLLEIGAAVGTKKIKNVGMRKDLRNSIVFSMSFEFPWIEAGKNKFSLKVVLLLAT